MKKLKKLNYVLVMCTVLFLLTGCVKFNANMDIKSDKSMDFSIIYAVNESLLDGEEIIDEEAKKSLSDQGFTVSEYAQGNMKGVSLSRKIDNIDIVSSTEDTEFSLSGIISDGSKDDKLFKVEKGLLKNTYTANFAFSTSDSALGGDDEENETTEDLATTEDDDTEIDWSYDEDDTEIDMDTETEDGEETEDDLNSQLEDYTNMMASMELTFNVSLPYAAKSNNATTVSSDNKYLTWNLASEDTPKVEFQFELYNMNVIYIGVGIVAVVIVAIVIAVSSGKKKQNNNATNENNEENQQM